MRLISQDGMIDVNYDNGSLCQGFIKGEEHLIYTISYYNYSCQKGTKLAEYSSRDKAIKVMEMLREQYFDNKHEETYRDGVFSYAPNFKFPDDSEVEV